MEKFQKSKIIFKRNNTVFFGRIMSGKNRTIDMRLLRQEKESIQWGINIAYRRIISVQKMQIPNDECLSKPYQW